MDGKHILGKHILITLPLAKGLRTDWTICLSIFLCTDLGSKKQFSGSSLIAYFQKQHSTPHLHICTFYTIKPASNAWDRGSCKNKVVLWVYSCPVKLSASAPLAGSPCIMFSQTKRKCNWCTDPYKPVLPLPQLSRLVLIILLVTVRPA